MSGEIEKSIQKSKASGRVIGPILMLIGLAVAAFAYFALSGRRDDLQIIVMIVGGLLFVPGAIIFLLVGLKNVNKDPIVAHLKNDPSSILWVVPVQILQAQRHINTELEIYFADGSKTVRRPWRDTAEIWIRELQAANPHLLVGAEYRDQYMRLRAQRG